jgi:hypothetical protein
VELDIYFDVSRGGFTRGHINLDGEITEISVKFDYGIGVAFFPYSLRYNGDERLFTGRCRFGEEEFVVTIFNNERGFLDDSIETLTFIRGEIPSDD